MLTSFNVIHCVVCDEFWSISVANWKKFPLKYQWNLNHTKRQVTTVHYRFPFRKDTLLLNQSKTFLVILVAGRVQIWCQSFTTSLHRWLQGPNHARSPSRAQIEVFIPNPMKARMAWFCTCCRPGNLFVPIHLDYSKLLEVYRWVYTFNVNPQKVLDLPIRVPTAFFAKITTWSSDWEKSRCSFNQKLILLSVGKWVRTTREIVQWLGLLLFTEMYYLCFLGLFVHHSYRTFERHWSLNSFSAISAMSSAV